MTTRWRVWLVLWVGVLVGGACAGGRYSLGSSTAPGVRSEVIVLGARPTVRVVNAGPGVLVVRMETERERHEERVDPGAAGEERRMAGPVHVWLEALGERVEWRVLARDAGGLRMDAIVERPD